MSEPATIAWIITIVVIVVSLLVIVVLSSMKKQGVRVPNYRGLFILGSALFIIVLVLMAVFVLVDVPFWIGIPVAVFGLVYQIIDLLRQWKTQGK